MSVEAIFLFGHKLMWCIHVTGPVYICVAPNIPRLVVGWFGGFFVGFLGFFLGGGWEEGCVVVVFYLVGCLLVFVFLYVCMRTACMY